MLTVNTKSPEAKLVDEVEKLIKQAQNIDAQLNNPLYKALVKKHKKSLADPLKASAIMYLAYSQIVDPSKLTSSITMPQVYVVERQKKINALTFFLECVLPAFENPQDSIKINYISFLLEHVSNVFRVFVNNNGRDYKTVINYYSIIKKYQPEIKKILDNMLDNEYQDNAFAIQAENLKKRLFGLYTHLFLVNVNYVHLCRRLNNSSETEEYALAKYTYAYLKTHLEKICSIAEFDLQKARDVVLEIQPELLSLYSLEVNLESKPFEKCWLEAKAYADQLEACLNEVKQPSVTKTKVVESLSVVKFDELRCIDILLEKDAKSLLDLINSSSEFQSSLKLALGLEWHDSNRLFIVLPKVSALIGKWHSAFQEIQDDYALLISARLKNLQTKIEETHRLLMFARIPQISEAIESEVMMIEANINHHPHSVEAVEKYKHIISDEEMSLRLVEHYFAKFNEDIHSIQSDLGKLTEKYEQAVALRCLSLLRQRINVSYFYLEHILPLHKANDDFFIPYSFFLLENIFAYYGIVNKSININSVSTQIEPVKPVYEKIENYYFIVKKNQPVLKEFIEKILNDKNSLTSTIKATMQASTYKCCHTLALTIASYIFLSCDLNQNRFDMNAMSDARYLIAFIKTHLEKISKISSTDIKTIKEELRSVKDLLDNSRIVFMMESHEECWIYLNTFAKKFTRTLLNLKKSDFRSSAIERDFLEVFESLKPENATLDPNLVISLLNKTNDLFQACSREQTKKLLTKLRAFFNEFQKALKGNTTDYAQLAVAMLETLQFKTIEMSVQLAREDLQKPSLEIKTINPSPSPNANNQTKAVKTTSPHKPILLTTKHNTTVRLSTTTASTTSQVQKTQPLTDSAVSYYSGNASELYDIKKLPKVKNNSQSSRHSIEAKPENAKKAKENNHKANNTKKNKKTYKEPIPKKANNFKLDVHEKRDHEVNDLKEDKYLSRDYVASAYGRQKQLIFTKLAPSVCLSKSKEQTFPDYSQKVLPLQGNIEAMDVERPKTDNEIDKLSAKIEQLSLDDDMHIPYEPTDLRIQIYNDEVIAYLVQLNQAGFWAFLVGGAVADLLQGRKPRDWDITTNCPKDKLKEIIINAYQNPLDKTQTRFKVAKDIDIFCSAQTIEEDLLKRDFYEKAFYADYRGRVFDIANKRKVLLRESKEFHFIGNPTVRLRDDPSLISRLVRHSTKEKKYIYTFFDSLQAVKSSYSAMDSGIYKKTFSDLFSQGQGFANWQTVKRLKLTKSLLPGGVDKHFEHDLRAAFLFIDSKLFEADQCSQEDREKQYSPYHHIALQLLPELVDKQNCDPNIACETHINEIIAYFFDNYQGEFNEGDKFCFEINLSMLLREYYQEYVNVSPIYEEELFQQNNLLLIYPHFQRGQARNNTNDANNTLVPNQENNASPVNKLY